MDYEKVDVECYSGYKVNEPPTAFTCQERRREIKVILDCWNEGSLDPGRPPIDYFKVRTVEGDVLLLRYLSLFDAWSVRVPD